MSTTVPSERPRILLWDVETSPLVVTTWGLFKPHLSHDNIQQESLVICAAWKWLGQEEVGSVGVNPARPKNDRRVITTLHRVLQEADVLVAHNGDKFDLRKFNARAIYYGMDPLRDIPTIDTLKVARRVASFNSNRLDYLGKFLCGVGKIKTDYDLWLRVMDGDQVALDQMMEYNRGDIIVLEKVYNRLRPYMKKHPNASLYREEHCCPTCGSTNLQKRGFKFQQTTRREAYQCKDCGAWSSGKFMGRAEVG